MMPLQAQLFMIDIDKVLDSNTLNIEVILMKDLL